AVADNISDDVAIGRVLRRGGGRLAFVSRPVVTVQGRMRVADFARHQLRWLRTWRCLGGPTWPLSLLFSSALLAAIGAAFNPVVRLAVPPLVLAEMGPLGGTQARLASAGADPGLRLLPPGARAVG